MSRICPNWEKIAYNDFFSSIKNRREGKGLQHEQRAKTNANDKQTDQQNHTIFFDLLIQVVNVNSVV